MSTIRVLVGTRKGAFILASDGKRYKRDVAGSSSVSTVPCSYGKLQGWRTTAVECE